nr:AAA family ATPase [Rhodanobacter spathiphylli]
MRNFRGFSDAFIPTCNTNFLVGENSTGKSSFLKTINILSQSQFYLLPDLVMKDTSANGVFDDFVSAWSKDRSFFEIGTAEVVPNKRKTAIRFGIYRFVDNDGAPKLNVYKLFLNGKFLEIDFSEKNAKYRITPFTTILPKSGNVDGGAILTQAESMADGKFKDFPNEFPSVLPLPFLLQSINKELDVNDEDKSPFGDPLLDGFSVTSIAPIRTAPKRFYDGVSNGYSPEGEHTPLLLRSSLKAGNKATQFAQKLDEFGKASGLFETIFPHAFGTDARAPFEIIVKFSGAEINMNNVGYGVSQALPLVVEFLTRPKARAFAVQQPEVHLHPRAQAALGGLIYSLAKSVKHSFFVETHSDYLIDRYRIEMHADKAKDKPSAQILFFVREKDGNRCHSIPILEDGSYSLDQPSEFRDFFVHEQLKLLDV